MSFMKFGELTTIGPSDIQTIESVFSDVAIEQRFTKFAKELKRIAPKADDFLYFSAIMMHAAESSAINSDGSVKLTQSGDPVVVGWEKKGDSIKWISNDPKIKPYANNNGDIFPEEELLKAYKKWIQKPLCSNHKSSSVDDIRGIILDTYYDRKMKRIIALCALDKATYPDLAKKITLGYSTNFSMGTAVGRAICMACGNVARVEADFCQHMKTKTGGGEANLDLSPIEFSIVVTPADPQAKLRTIIAAANTVNSQLEQQEKELSNITADQLDKLEASLKDASEKLAELKDIIESNEESETASYGQTGDVDPPIDDKDQSFGLNFPERYATNDVYMSEVKNLKASLETRLLNMEKILNKLNSNKEDAMNKEGYFQGAGGVNEPTPGQKKYPVDPKNEDLRMKDKHMVGEPPFPEVGAVDGLHPSPASADEKDELERKKMLARAERRSAALEKAKENVMNYKKEAYFQGGGGVNEPTPGKVKYPVDKLQEEDRDKKDKHMVGQKPFPGVGAVDGLHPSPLSADEKDELKRKELLQRASLKAKFVRVANIDGTDNQAESAWQVYAKDENGEKLVFSASVDEISGGRSEALFTSIATKEFGTKMLEKIRTVGLVKAAAVYKKAQAVAGPAATPGLPADVGGAGAMPAMPEALPAAGPSDAAPEDDGGKGDPKDTANKLAEKVRDLSSDLLEAVRSLTGEQAQMGEMEGGLEALPKSASSTLAPLYKMRRELNSALVSGIKKSLAALKEHAEELDLISDVSDSGSAMDPEYINTIAEDAFDDVKKSIADASGLMKGVSKYAHGTAGLLKRAEEVEQSALLSLADEDENDARRKAKKKKESEEDEDKTTDEDKSSADDDLFDFDSMLDDDFGDTEMGGEEEHHNDLGLEHNDDEMGEEHHEEEDHNDEPANFDFDGMEDMPTDDMNDTMVELPPGAAVPSGAKAVSEGNKVAFDLTTRAGRTAYRAKLAGDATGKEDSGEHSDESKLPHPSEYDDAHKLTDGQTELDVKPSDNLGYVENELEQHKRDMEVARMEPKVRSEAARLDQLISEGKVKATDLDSLVSHGLDADVVKYWKQYYGEAGKEGSEFAKLLTTETMKAKADEENKTYRVKLARAYELANEMVRCGTLSNDRSSISSQVDEIMKWNDDAFESCKRVIAKQAAQTVKKSASYIPQVGLIGTGDNLSQNPASNDLQSELENAFSGRRY